MVPLVTHREKAAKLAEQLHQVRRELQECQQTSEELDAIEERYWHDYNEYQMQLRNHVDERDGLLNKIDRASQRLHILRNTNVYNDAFKIWWELGHAPQTSIGKQCRFSAAYP